MGRNIQAAGRPVTNLLRLSVKAAAMKPAPPGPLASYSTCRAMRQYNQERDLVLLSDMSGTRPHPACHTSLKSVLTSEARLMLRSTMSLGTFCSFAVAMRSRSRIFDVGSGPPARTACTISLPILPYTLDLIWSERPCRPQ